MIDGSLEFLFIDFREDLDFASRTVIELLERLFGVGSSDNVLVRLENATINDDEVTDR